MTENPENSSTQKISSIQLIFYFLRPTEDWSVLSSPSADVYRMKNNLKIFHFHAAINFLAFSGENCYSWKIYGLYGKILHLSRKVKRVVNLRDVEICLFQSFSHILIAVMSFWLSSKYQKQQQRWRVEWNFPTNFHAYTNIPEPCKSAISCPFLIDSSTNTVQNCSQESNNNKRINRMAWRRRLSGDQIIEKKETGFESLIVAH